jgi:integrase
MRRRRYQKPRVSKVNGYWIGQYRDLSGRKRKASFGPVRTTRKGDAEKKFDEILAPINARRHEPSPEMKFGHFVRQVFFPFYKRKWKQSTADSNEPRIEFHLISAFENRPLSSFRKGRDELQTVLDGKAASGLSYSVVAHVRWDLRQIFRLAVSDGYLDSNPAEELFIPSEARRPETRTMTLDQVKLFFSVLDFRERVIGGLAVLAGLRPGEILALTRSRIEKDFADIKQRVYRGEFDSPKTFKSIRWAALGDGLLAWLNRWLEMLPDTGPEAWVFPSERLTTPLSKDNCLRRGFQPRLKAVGLDWVNFQVMRRTHSSLSSDLGVDPQIRAEQMGHGVDVNQNTYTRASLEKKKEAVNTLEKAVGVM